MPLEINILQDLLLLKRLITKSTNKEIVSDFCQRRNLIFTTTIQENKVSINKVKLVPFCDNETSQKGSLQYSFGNGDLHLENRANF